MVIKRSNKVYIPSHIRRIKGKKYKVKGYKRTSRQQGKKVVRYAPVGVMEVGFDKYGNIKKTRIIKSKVKKARKTRPSNKIQARKIDQLYLANKIDHQTWVKKQAKLI